MHKLKSPIHGLSFAFAIACGALACSAGGEGGTGSGGSSAPGAGGFTGLAGSGVAGSGPGVAGSGGPAGSGPGRRARRRGQRRARWRHRGQRRPRPAAAPLARPASPARASGGTPGTAGSAMAGTAGTAGAPGGGAGGAAPVIEPTLITSANNNFWKVGAVTEVTSGTADVTVNDSSAQQTWNGMGGTFNEQGWNVLSMLSASERDRAIKLLFDANEGAKFSYGRVPIGASDYAMDRYTLNETAGDTAMASFSIERDKQKLIPSSRPRWRSGPTSTCGAAPGRRRPG